VTEGGADEVYHHKKRDWQGREEKYFGDRREPYHPYDRKSGTGRGRELHKGGHGKGNWGDTNDEVKTNAEGVEGTTETKEEGKTAEPKPEGEKEEGTKVDDIYEEERRKRMEEEEKEKNLRTLDDFLAGKKVSQFKKEARKAEEVKKTNIEKKTEGKDKISTLNNQLKDQDVYSVSVGQSAENKLLGFVGEQDEYERGPRDRGGYGGERGGYGGGRGRGGQRKGGNKLYMNEEEFPTL